MDPLHETDLHNISSTNKNPQKCDESAFLKMEIFVYISLSSE